MFTLYSLDTYHEYVPLDAARAHLLVGVLDPRPDVLAVLGVPVGDRVAAVQFGVEWDALERANSFW